jgi:hypothetical protein
MAKKTESTVANTTEIQVDTPLTDANKVKYSNELLEAWDLMDEAESDIKDYIKQRKDDAEKYENLMADIRYKIKNAPATLPDSDKTKFANELLNAMNKISEIDDDVRAYKAVKQSEIAKCEAVMNICKIKLNRGKDVKWMKVKVFKDFAGKTKTFFNIDTGEAVQTVPLSEDDMQLGLEEQGNEDK